MFVIVTVSVPALVVIAMPGPATNVNVSPALSAKMLGCPLTSTVENPLTDEPPIVVPAGKLTAAPVAVIVADPNLILDPLRYKSFQR